MRLVPKFTLLRGTTVFGPVGAIDTATVIQTAPWSCSATAAVLIV